MKDELIKSSELLEKLEIHKKRVPSLQEYELFMFLDKMDGLKAAEQKVFYANTSTIENKEQKNLFFEKQMFYQEMITITDNELKRFDVDPSSKLVVNKNSPYWKWKWHWNQWKLRLSDDEWALFITKLKNKESIDALLPKKKWHENIGKKNLNSYIKLQ